MKIAQKIKQLGHCKHLIKIEIPREEIDIVLNQIYSKIQKEATLPGFRRGKAPRQLIETNYKDYATKEAIEQLVDDSCRDALKNAQLRPIGLPMIENIKFQEGQSLSFDANFEIMPRVDIKDYKGLAIKKKSDEVKDIDVDNMIENIRELHAQYKTIPPRPVNEGDFILCDLEWFVEGNPIDKKEKIIVSVEKKTLTQNVFDGILGGAVGEKKSISINIDKTFPKPEYVGKSGILEIYIHEIKAKELPILDDEFAKELGSFKQIKDLKENIKGHLIDEKRQSVRFDMQDQIIGQLLKTHSFQLPQSLVEAEIKTLREDAREKFMRKGYGEKEIDELMNKEKDALNEKFKLHAENHVKAFFIMGEIAQKENLNAAEEELNGLIENLAARHKKNPAHFKEQLKKDGKIDSLYWQLTEAKVMQFLLDNAKIEDSI